VFHTNYQAINEKVGEASPAALPPLFFPSFSHPYYSFQVLPASKPTAIMAICKVTLMD
jgi:hypothetical protein